MAIDPAQLLRQLEPAVRPGSAPAAPARTVPSVERADFGELLSLVSKGTIHSGRPAAVAPGAAIAPPLQPAQLDRIAAAADLLEAAGAKRALLLVDGRGLVLDVESRHITSELSASSPPEVVAIDAAVSVAGEDEDVTGEPSAPPALARGIMPATVARLLHATPEPSHPATASTPSKPPAGGEG
jgi:hypothetical protein